ncbi:MAG: 16S rRNA (cytidine(1402)-2'-O)-methyltransferase [Lachnospiraceae bacterium]|nr:16S rRNA (cytidine(1402)-2'-O)-methyltransferase [Lachnospiraceae bacterium]
MAGKLYLCATPIGNLGDVTGRVLEALKEADLIACEDTRNSIRLLNHFDIHTPMTSYHEFNKYDKADVLIKEMQDGKNVALISDAGTPSISDPGEVLVQKCIEAGIEVTSLPGASAVITALTLSGLSARRFCFEGFLPRDKKERLEVLTELKSEYRTTVLYEAPHHLKGTLNDLYESLGEREIALCRELTKKHEEVLRMGLKEAIDHYDKTEPKGEFVLVLSGADKKAALLEERAKVLEISIKEHFEKHLAAGLDKKAAMKKVAEERGIPKREVYNSLLEVKEDE